MSTSSFAIHGRNHYYLISPNADLLKLMDSKGDFTFVMKQPVLWNVELVGRVFISKLEQPLEVKLLFIANLKTQWRRTTNSLLLQFLDEILRPPLGVVTFDRWWTLQPIGGGMTTLAWAANHIDIDVLRSLSKTGDSIADGWLEWLIDQRTEDLPKKDAED